MNFMQNRQSVNCVTATHVQTTCVNTLTIELKYHWISILNISYMSVYTGLSLLTTSENHIPYN